MTSRSGRLLRALLPLGLAGFALLALFLDPGGDGRLARGLGTPLAARASGVLVLVVGWRFQRGRAIWAAALLLALAEMERRGLPVGEPVLGWVARGLAVLALGVAVWWVEAPLGSRRTAWRLVGLGAAVGGLVVLGHPELDGLVAAVDAAGRDSWGAWIAGRTGIPLPGPPLATVGALVGLALGALGWTVRRRSLDGGLVAAALLLGAAQVPSGPAPGSLGVATTASAALLILAVTIVEGGARLAFEDPLTGLPGRRALEERLARLSGDYCLAMADLDRFKKLNDRWGHEVGDQVLGFVASKLRRVGGGGEAFRYGGEEMAIVFDRCDRDRAEEALEEVRRSIADHPFRQRSAPRKGGAKKGAGRRIPVTVSIGLAASDTADGPGGVLKAADKALYRAKRAGRNRVVVAGRRRRKA